MKSNRPPLLVLEKLKWGRPLGAYLSGYMTPFETLFSIIGLCSACTLAVDEQPKLVIHSLGELTGKNSLYGTVLFQRDTI